MVPEVGTTLGLKLTCHLQLRAGYSLLYWPDCATVFDPVNPGSFTRESVFWQSVNLGLRAKY